MCEIHYRTCNFCEAVCGIEIEHADGEILSIRGDKKTRFHAVIFARKLLL